MAVERSRVAPVRPSRRDARPRMDLLALAGVVVGFMAILGGSLLEGIPVAGLVNLPAAIIVLGGTLGAVVLQTPAATLRGALTRLRWVLTPPPPELEWLVDRMGDWAKHVRRGGLVSLEEIASGERDPFVRNGMQLVADGGDVTMMRRTLELENDNRLAADLAAAGVFRSMGGYAPTIGILGAVLGLIQVMGHLDDPDQLGIGIATAFVATIYGVGSANLVFLPLADRLRVTGEGQWHRRSLIIEGLSCLTEGEHPSKIRARLAGYLAGR